MIEKIMMDIAIRVIPPYPNLLKRYFPILLYPLSPTFILRRRGESLIVGFPSAALLL
jgi:hypothetical protein